MQTNKREKEESINPSRENLHLEKKKSNQINCD
jgi:hypothetical protein